MNILKTISENDTMLDLMNNAISNIKFYIIHRDELADIKISDEFLSQFIAKMEEVKCRYDTNKVPNWFKEYKASLLLSSDFPYITTSLGFTFSLYDMVNMVLCEDMTYKYSETESYIIETTKLVDSQHVIIYFKCGSSLLLDKDEWDTHFKLFF